MFHRDKWTGAKLCPGKPDKCQGNGKHHNLFGKPIECCCDECAWFLKCFPEEEFDRKQSDVV